MLDSIRTNAQSFGVKIAFGVIILVFVFWGVGSFTDGDTSHLMARVNGDSILETQFYKRYQMIEQQLMSRGMSREQMKSEHLGRQVLQNMIAHTLVRQEADRLGIGITPLELRMAIEQNPLFHNAEGKLDKDSYERGLNALRLSPADFEQQMRDELLFEKMLELVSSSIWVDPDAARNRFNFLFEKRIFDYIFIPAADFLSKVKVTNEEGKAYYEEHGAEFTLPKKAALTLVRLSPATLVDPKTIPESDAKAWYEKNHSRYMQKEAVRVAHILVPLAENASEAETKAAEEKIQGIYDALAKGKTFAELANQYNEPNAANSDGELGWVERGVTVEPFEKAAFSQKPGVVSEKPVRSKFGLHLILVHEKRDEKQKTFEEVEGELRKTMAEDLGQDRVHEVGEALLEATLLGKDLADSAAEHSVKVEKTEPMSADELVKSFGFSPQDAQLILSGTPIDTLLQAGDDAVVVRVDKVIEATKQPYETVEKTIMNTLAAKKATEAALEKASVVRKTLQDGPLTEEQRKSLGLKKTDPFDRTEDIAPFEGNENLTKACFEAAKDAWLDKAYAVKLKKEGLEGAVLMRLHAVQPASAEDWDRIHSFLENGYIRDTADNIRSFFMNELFKKAKITDVQVEKADRMDG